MYNDTLALLLTSLLQIASSWNRKFILSSTAVTLNKRWPVVTIVAMRVCGYIINFKERVEWMQNVLDRLGLSAGESNIADAEK